MEEQFQRSEPLLNPEATKRFLTMQLATRPYEVFAGIYLDNRHQVLAFEEMFRGTVESCAVYPREVVKQALHYNAAAMILTHNHPSGFPDPSEVDKQMTRKLKEALALMNIRVLDHIVVGGTETVSFAERGLL